MFGIVSSPFIVKKVLITFAARDIQRIRNENILNTIKTIVIWMWYLVKLSGPWECYHCFLSLCRTPAHSLPRLQPRNTFQPSLGLLAPASEMLQQGQPSVLPTSRFPDLSQVFLAGLNMTHYLTLSRTTDGPFLTTSLTRFCSGQYFHVLCLFRGYPPSTPGSSSLEKELCYC